MPLKSGGLGQNPSNNLELNKGQGQMALFYVYSNLLEDPFHCL